MIDPSRSRRVLPATNLLALLFLLTGCTTHDMSSHPGQVTDFRVGYVYQLKVPAFVLAHTGLVMTAEEARKREPAQAEALLDPGTYFKVRQIVSVKDRETGPRTEIYAEIITGPRAGRIVNLRTASLGDGPPGTTRRNPAVLEPFLMGR